MKTLLSVAASTAALISAFVWSAVALASTPSNFVPSAATSLPSTVPVTDMFPFIVAPAKVGELPVPNPMLVAAVPALLTSLKLFATNKAPDNEA